MRQGRGARGQEGALGSARGLPALLGSAGGVEKEVCSKWNIREREADWHTDRQAGRRTGKEIVKMREKQRKSDSQCYS